MDSVINAVERIRQLPGAFVDVNYRQSRELFAKQMAGRMGVEALSSHEIDQDIAGLQGDIVGLAAKVEPYDLPENYVFFLEYYGGLAVWQPSEYRFEVQGVGPMVNEEYGDFAQDNWGQRNDPLLPGPRGLIIAHLRLDMDLSKAKARGLTPAKMVNVHKQEVEYMPPKWVEFRLDVAGTIQKHAILGLGPNEADALHPLSFDDGDKRTWRKLADSFTDWLDLAAKTRGTFGYEY
jgi:hypothetical protein